MIILRDSARGFTIVAAIFILVILASLGAFILTVSTTQHIGSALDVQGAQAYRAAQSGIEWGAYNSLNSVAPCNLAVIGSTATTDISAISGMQVTVQCTLVQTGSAVEPGLGAIYSITATACNMPLAVTPRCPGTPANPNYVERRLTVMVER